jgi:hypothetical protein
MVRRLVPNGWQPPTFGMLRHREMIALDALLLMPGDRKDRRGVLTDQLRLVAWRIDPLEARLALVPFLRWHEQAVGVAKIGLDRTQIEVESQARQVWNLDITVIQIVGSRPVTRSSQNGTSSPWCSTAIRLPIAAPQCTLAMKPIGEQHECSV